MLFNVLAESKVKWKHFLEDCKAEVFLYLSILNRHFNLSLLFCRCKEGVGFNVKNAKIFMTEADVSGVGSCTTKIFWKLLIWKYQANNTVVPWLLGTAFLSRAFQMLLGS